METRTKIIHYLEVKDSTSFNEIKQSLQEVEEYLYKMYRGQDDFDYEIQIIGRRFVAEDFKYSKKFKG